MLQELYPKYFQKSKSFLFPILGIKKHSVFKVTDTYVCWEGMYKASDRKLICVYENIDQENFKEFEESVLISNPLYHSCKKTADNKGIYVFDFTVLKKDFDKFIAGKYSGLSKLVKDAILKYYGEKSKEHEYIMSYLYPKDYFENYAKLLDVDIKIIREVGELCSIYDPDLETCKLTVEYLECSAEFV